MKFFLFIFISAFVSWYGICDEQDKLVHREKCVACHTKEAEQLKGTRH